MKEINCEEISEYYKNKILQLPVLKMINEKPKLITICIGSETVDKFYQTNVNEMCDEFNIEFNTINFDSNIDVEIVLSTIYTLNENNNVAGILVQLPIAKELKEYESIILDAIDVTKDVGGMTIQSKYLPSIAMGTIGILEYLGFPSFERLNVLLIGNDKEIVQPLANILIQQDATLIVCNSHTPEYTIFHHFIKADIVISAVGKCRTIKQSWLDEKYEFNKIIIDVGADCKVGDFEYSKNKNTNNDNVCYTPYRQVIELMASTCICMNTYTAFIDLYYQNNDIQSLNASVLCDNETEKKSNEQ